jgi:hypothetical protein
VAADASGRGRGAADRGMQPDEVIMSEVQRHGRPVVFDLLAEPVGEPREPAHGHPHGQVLPLDQAGRDMVLIGVTHDRRLFRSYALWGLTAK